MSYSHAGTCWGRRGKPAEGREEEAHSTSSGAGQRPHSPGPGRASGYMSSSESRATSRNQLKESSGYRELTNVVSTVVDTAEEEQPKSSYMRPDYGVLEALL